MSVNKPFVYVMNPALLPYIFEDCMRQDSVAVDVETTRRRDLPLDLVFNDGLFKPGLDPYLSEIRLLQLGTEEKVYVIDCFCCEDAVYIFEELFMSENILKIFHNSKFDMKMLMRQFGFRFRRTYDTMLASQLLSNGIPAHKRKHSLAAVALRYLGITLDKTEQTSDWGAQLLSEKQLEYAAKDVAILQDLARAQQKYFVNDRGIDLNRVVKLENNCAIAFARMELDGVYVDADYWADVNADLVIKFKEIHNELLNQFKDQALNLNSPKQLIVALGKQGIDVPDTSSDTLSPLKDTHPIIGLLLEYRGLAKLLSSYGNGIPGKKRKKGQVFFIERIHPITGRIHPEFSQLYAETGRTACSSPNVQQVPNLDKASFRHAFCGQIFDGVKNDIIVADYSQIEMRILAELSNDPALMKAFKMGGDLHTATAALMFDVAPETIQYKDPQTGKKIKGPNYWMRSASKSINFGLVYGRGPLSLAGQIGVSIDEAKQLITKYFNTYPSIGVWLSRAANFAVRNGYCTTTSGRIRYFDFNPKNRAQRSAVEREGKNTPIQGTSADITKIALYRVHLATEHLIGQVFMSNTIHDEVVVEAPPEMSEYVGKLLVTEMEAAAYELLHNVPVIAECGIGADWTVK